LPERDIYQVADVCFAAEPEREREEVADVLPLHIKFAADRAFFRGGIMYINVCNVGERTPKTMYIQ